MTSAQGQLWVRVRWPATGRSLSRGLQASQVMSHPVSGCAVPLLQAPSPAPPPLEAAPTGCWDSSGVRLRVGQAATCRGATGRDQLELQGVLMPTHADGAGGPEEGSLGLLQTQGPACSAHSLPTDRAAAHLPGPGSCPSLLLPRLPPSLLHAEPAWPCPRAGPSRQCLSQVACPGQEGSSSRASPWGGPRRLGTPFSLPTGASWPPQRGPCSSTVGPAPPERLLQHQGLDPPWARRRAQMAQRCQERHGPPERPGAPSHTRPRIDLPVPAVRRLPWPWPGGGAACHHLCPAPQGLARCPAGSGVGGAGLGRGGLGWPRRCPLPTSSCSKGTS